MTMSSPSAATGVNSPEDIKQYHTFITLALILALITGVEIVVIYIEPLSWWFVATSLIVLSTVKFVCVVAWFMHLVYDKVFNTVLFAIGMIIAAGTVAALLFIFYPPHSFTIEEMEEFEIQYPRTITPN